MTRTMPHFVSMRHCLYCERFIVAVQLHHILVCKIFHNGCQCLENIFLLQEG